MATWHPPHSTPENKHNRLQYLFLAQHMPSPNQTNPPSAPPLPTPQHALIRTHPPTKSLKLVQLVQLSKTYPSPSPVDNLLLPNSHICSHKHFSTVSGAELRERA
ncbi:uncharacterized protein BDR25DRAFT_306222 [Lindgomyces ingoldianus]|uniref:Uncharacterized protein n=1 Tax=Lindgomyces ingoldianus TaxID=673940 RepID=A0ACB6QIU7_9PLEO|nr:uncharacterized protein BDR25DRAFT_306222 [Lindgomyces ingoldianus]KAF2466435.1 hypothetical protein BDR25DRAFT_306222 [Lindgomyces ingoldianus]